ncbi:MAG TPA: formate dehydrogenase accessory sulfurtransferase FdhD [Abditibacteriaceae bacterium]|nr:formate dehydrogenase accessory sulfurtransferase FdhD [Abditibacteriaceae bacterium]
MSIDAAKVHHVTRLRHGEWTTVADCLVVEEPLEIRIDGRRYTATMRTPGHDIELARGLLFTEGVVQDKDDIEEITCRTACRERSEELINIVDVVLHDSENVPAHLWERSLISNSSCGLCGKASIEAMQARVSPLAEYSPFAVETLLRLPHIMREQQTLFQSTGGLHAAGIFNRSGQCLALFEDIGRHNATDKAIGFGLEQGWLPWRTPGEPLALLVSGRGSFEITQKALVARIPIVCSVSAASTLAVELAEANNQTLIGFLREAGMTINTGRI